ncbi:unnamed protein product [Durusdinium trenchii]|uniref:F5/8 type C domain-containing protein n=1 Tax=Durusdinium trenchii TaxID=1381693 RepID=A0ABP0QVL8_9DINO
MPLASSFLGHPAMLISGASAKKELCLVAKEGIPQMETCEDAVRAGDGREIWHLSKGALVALDGRCLLRQGRNLRLGSCDEQPGQVWELLGTDQLQLSPGGLCLTVSAEPSVDVAQNQSAHASSSIDAYHTAAQAVDGNDSSYWAADPEAETAMFEVAFPAAKLKVLEINWESVPDSFKLQTSMDGLHWRDAYSVHENLLRAHRSRIHLKGVEANSVRLQVHGSDGIGIREFKLFSLKHSTGLENCQTPKMARDKWFLSSVAEFDPTVRLRTPAPVSSNAVTDESWVVDGRPGQRLVASFTDALSPDELKPLTQFRQQHRRTLDGFLCAAAFVQDGNVYTNCTDAPTPEGGSGREWCYLDPQLQQDFGSPSWGYCAPVVDYDALRRQ